MNTLNTMKRVREDRWSLAINKLELLNQEHVRSILDYLEKNAHASMADLVTHTGLPPQTAKHLLDQLLLHRFIWKDAGGKQTGYSINHFHLKKVSLIAKRLAGFWSD